MPNSGEAVPLPRVLPLLHICISENSMHTRVTPQGHLVLQATPDCTRLCCASLHAALGPRRMNWNTLLKRVSDVEAPSPPLFHLVLTKAVWGKDGGSGDPPCTDETPRLRKAEWFLESRTARVRQDISTWLLRSSSQFSVYLATLTYNIWCLLASNLQSFWIVNFSHNYKMLNIKAITIHLWTGELGPGQAIERLVKTTKSRTCGRLTDSGSLWSCVWGLYFC